MREFYRGMWVVAYREIIRFYQDRGRMISSFAMPIVFLVIFGAGFNRTIGALMPGVDFVKFIFPGTVSQTVFMNSLFAGLSVVWDKEFGFLREILVAPISRPGVVIGKVIGGATLALLVSLLMLVLAPIINVTLSPMLVLKLIPLLILMSFTLSSLGILLASRMRSQQGFQILMQVFIMPMIFLSGIFFPVNNVPRWFEVASKLNPLTYGVDAVRQLFLDRYVIERSMPFSVPSPFGVTVFGHRMTILQDALVVGVAGLAMLAVAVWSFNRQE
ncbi:MAG: ABC transporter permease [Chloroflexi bacterium]|nr:ABC transporter permease [Chloroflexota bacterium]